MMRRLLHVSAMVVVLHAGIQASSAGPLDCKAVCEWQEYECQHGGGGWQQDCDDISAYYDWDTDTCNLDAFCLY